MGSTYLLIGDLTLTTKEVSHEAPVLPPACWRYPRWRFACALLPTLSVADTYLPDGPVTHVDFTLGLKLHADGFPESKAHLSDWETFLNKLDLRGSMDTLAMLTPDSRVYLNGALRLNGKDQVPFVYDGYHSYRYLSFPPRWAMRCCFSRCTTFWNLCSKPITTWSCPHSTLRC